MSSTSLLDLEDQLIEAIFISSHLRQDLRDQPATRQKCHLPLPTRQSRPFPAHTPCRVAEARVEREATPPTSTLSPTRTGLSPSSALSTPSS